MAKVKKFKVNTEKDIQALETASEIAVNTFTPTAYEIRPRVDLITHEFGNGDMNVLRDKINEIIKSYN